MSSILLFIAVIAGCAGLLWLSYKIEPHWVSKDGERLVCAGQGISRFGDPQGRWREVRITRVSGDVIELRPRRGNFSADRSPAGSHRSVPDSPMTAGWTGFRVRRNPRVTYWRVSCASDNPPKRRAVYLLDGNTDQYMPDMIAIRLPANSRAIPMLEALATNKTKNASTVQTSSTVQTASMTRPESKPTRRQGTRPGTADQTGTESKNADTGGAT